MLRTWITISLSLLIMNESSAQQFSEGQVWHYKARPHEATSTIQICKIESDPRMGEMFHISIRGLRMKNPRSPTGFNDQMSHAPVSRQTLAQSVTKLSGTSSVDPGYREGYATWRKAFEQGDAGIFTIPVAEIVSGIETAINK
jgi:hypothetical protein